MERQNQVIQYPGERAPALPQQRTKPTMPERLLAASAHVLTVFSIPGTLVATVIWLTNRRRSPYVAHQARQAVLWQLLGHAILLLALVVLLAFALVSLGGTIQASGVPAQHALTRLLGSLAGVYFVLIGGAAFFVGSAVFGTVAALLGRNYTYPALHQRS